MNKKEIRFGYRQKRAALASDRLTIASQQICDQFFADTRISRCLARPNAIVHTYLPMARQNEVDTWPLIHQLWRDFPQVRIWSSVTEPKTHTLHHFQLTAHTPLTETKWGIPVPSGTFRQETGQPDLVIVPLLAFDKQGNRVGYGGGYYDRFLAQTSPDCLKVGLSFFEPIEQIDEVEKTDVRLNGCLMSVNVCWFS